MSEPKLAAGLRAAAGPGRRCRRCGRRHRYWFTVARRRWPRTIWLRGWPPEDGPAYAVLAHCRPGLTVALYATAALARQARERIDAHGCGGRCRGAHDLVTLGGPPTAGKLNPHVLNPHV